jgi:hypothetical protein
MLGQAGRASAKVLLLSAGQPRLVGIAHTSGIQRLKKHGFNPLMIEKIELTTLLR